MVTDNPPLTTDAFLTAVHTLDPRVAVFDFDGTLWPGDAGKGFMDWSIEIGLLAADRAAWLQQRHAAYLQGGVDEITICGEMVQVYAGLRDDDLRRAATEYFEQHVRLHLFPVMVDLLRSLQARGTEIWAVSSTNNWVIEAGVRELGIAPQRVLAACIAGQGGILTESLIDVPSDEKKAEALRRSGVVADAVFGNSIHDAAMLRMARAPFAINPNAGLLPIALQQGWPVYFPASESGFGEVPAPVCVYSANKSLCSQ